MKRKNPETGKPFKRWDTDPKIPNLVFRRFIKNKLINSTGYYEEDWVSEKKLKELTQKDKQYMRSRRSKPKTLPKRKNPLTGKEFKRWDELDGKEFVEYLNYDDPNTGYRGEYWVKDRTKVLIKDTHGARKRHAKEKNIKFDVSIDYLIEILPADMICPVFNIKMEWNKGERKDNNPSIDRVIPEKGYVKGNLVWISHKANRIKSDATKEEVKKVYDWLSKY
jgi:hypothetical protein